MTRYLSNLSDATYKQYLELHKLHAVDISMGKKALPKTNNGPASFVVVDNAGKKFHVTPPVYGNVNQDISMLEEQARMLYAAHVATGPDDAATKELQGILAQLNELRYYQASVRAFTSSFAGSETMDNEAMIEKLDSSIKKARAALNRVPKADKPSNVRAARKKLATLLSQKAALMRQWAVPQPIDFYIKKLPVIEISADVPKRRSTNKSSNSSRGRSSSRSPSPKRKTTKKTEADAAKDAKPKKSTKTRSRSPSPDTKKTTKKKAVVAEADAAKDAKPKKSTKARSRSPSPDTKKTTKKKAVVAEPDAAKDAKPKKSTKARSRSPSPDTKKTTKKKAVDAIKDASANKTSTISPALKKVIGASKLLSKIPFSSKDECKSKATSKPYYVSKEALINYISEDSKLKASFKDKNYKKLNKDELCDTVCETLKII